MAEDLFGIVGTVIASAYHVEHVVAEGGFGIVYRARHEGFRAPVALKCLKVPQHLGAEYQRRFVELFRAEGELMFRLSASIATVVRPLHVDVMTTRAGVFVPFMVLEWLEGETLDALLRARVAAGKRPPPLAEALSLLEPVALALARAHDFSGPAGRESIAHCDIKPENVFIARAGGERVIKMLDFGVAKVRNAATRAAAGAGNSEPALFTPAYGAPEHWNPKTFGETGPWTDVWGLGLTLVETLVGRPVIAGDRATMMRQVLDPKRRPTPAAHGVVVGDAFEAVLMRALALNPRERYPEAGAFWRAVRDAAARPVEVALGPAPEIPDLVPISRRPSGAHKLEQRTPSGAHKLEPGRTPSGAQRLELGVAARGKGEPAPARTASGAHQFDLPSVGSVDFEDDSAGESSGLALDIAEHELVRGGSLASLAPPLGAAELPSNPPISMRADALAAPTAPLPEQASPPPAGLPPVSQDISLPPPVSPPISLVPTTSSAPPTAKSPAPASTELKRSPAPSHPEPSWARRLTPGLALAGASIGVTVLDRIYAAVSGEVFSLGPLRTSWLAAVLLLAGVALVMRQVLART